MEEEIIYFYNVKDGKYYQSRYTHRWLNNLQQQVKKQKEVIDKLNFIKNRKNQGASQENINKMAIEFVNSYLKEV